MHLAMNLLDFSNDVFLIIIAYLSPRELILARCVSKQLRAALTEDSLNRRLLSQHFPRARELRRLDDGKDEIVHWAAAFANVASRYHHLKAGRPQAIEKWPLGKSLSVPAWSRFYPVATWKRHLQFEEKTAIFHYPDTLWTYDSGILIFPSAELEQYILYDISARSKTPIDVQATSKVVRRLRLKDRLLIVEWCEPNAYHQLNENEEVHRHFATAYDLLRDAENGEFQAVFSAWGEDDPIKSLAIWDISSPSPYRPSEDPTGKRKPEDSQGAKPIHHRWIVGQEASHSHPRLHKLKTTGIPFGEGPFWRDKCGADGDVNLSFCQRGSDFRGPHKAPCCLHEEFPCLTITEAMDAEAGVTFSARHCFMLETISINIKPKIQMTGPGYEISLGDDLWQQLPARGKLCGDERWLIGENNHEEVVILRFGG
ncbi:hypothetical protein BJ875DRAFT_528267 [Amylocarpus encephaloides]|uniref:F-box domain-containing protein n=1 Tax=Amylocarpus encephaloides TaxID=45428 RepID=A0A9P7YLG0_9HELO|nr:hypothetical protein BJ875DRAFT_528267 [Amylocarpus encephaloides]